MMVPEKYREKVVDFEGLCELIKPGSRIFLSSGPATPLKWVTDMLKSSHYNLQDLEIIQLITVGGYLSNEEQNSKYRLKTFFAGESVTRQIHQGAVDFIPAHIVEIPLIFASGAVGVDVAIVQTSPPDEKGFLNLGVVMDVADIVIKDTPLVIAEINPNMPVTNGATSIHMDQVNYLFESDLPIYEQKSKEYDEIIDKIGWHVSNLIDDGSTVSLHIGRTYDAVASHLKTSKGLRIYTNVISDWIIDLVESGSLSIDRGINNIGPVTTSYCIGTKKLYSYIDGNPFFDFVPLLRLANQPTVMRFPKMVSIMNVSKVDIAADRVAYLSGDDQLTGYESKLSFAMSTAFSRGGKAIVTLRSVDLNGNSNIVVAHDDKKERVRSTLGITRYVVTEYGVANIFGKSIRERALAMIDIAHPDHRGRLLEEAKQQGYIYHDQIYVIENAINYPFSLETVKSFKDGLEIKFRPIKPSDEDMMRHLFYQFSDEAKYLRYFVRVRAMPHKKMQQYVNIDYDKVLSLVGVVERKGNEHIIAEGRYAFDSEDNSYEMAFIVNERYGGKGIAAFLFGYLVKIAQERGIERLTASVLAENRKMRHVFDKSEIEPKIVNRGREIYYRFDI
ncbi:MAG: GNAT family N-acetyltransferase [bacterium]|nr:GNAT family N-acetyltransferase [bacterium]